jgi:hypothetical protein
MHHHDIPCQELTGPSMDDTAGMALSRARGNRAFIQAGATLVQVNDDDVDDDDDDHDDDHCNCHDAHDVDKDNNDDEGGDMMMVVMMMILRGLALRADSCFTPCVGRTVCLRGWGRSTRSTSPSSSASCGP